MCVKCQPNFNTSTESLKEIYVYIYNITYLTFNHTCVLWWNLVTSHSAWLSIVVNQSVVLSLQHCPLSIEQWWPFSISPAQNLTVYKFKRSAEKKQTCFLFHCEIKANFTHEKVMFEHRMKPLHSDRTWNGPKWAHNVSVTFSFLQSWVFAKSFICLMSTFIVSWIVHILHFAKHELHIFV